jgi:quinoprotein glucose dehydrogenase
MIDGVLYFSTPSDRVIAIGAADGKEKWVFDPHVDLHRDFSEISSRGVASWPAGASPKIIFVGTIDGRLIALDAGTGQPVPGFGKDGTIDLKEGLGGDIAETSPPAVIGDRVIVGASLGDNQRIDYPPGLVRAYSVKDGKLEWSWDPIAAHDPADSAAKTWVGPYASRTGGANAWTVLSTDPARGLVFVPATSPSPDYYGGERKGSDLYANSIVALHAATGKIAWYFQVVHHDLWDFDIAAQPMLIDVTKDGRKQAAVAVGTKMGHIFILDRDSGKPLFPVEERPVPASTVEGEEASPTQPFPVLPAPLGIQGFTVADAWGPTPEDKAAAVRRVEGLLNKGPFTPPSFQGSIMAPGNVGGIHWGGMCYDPEHEWLITNINQVPAVIRMLPREKLGQLERENEEVLRAETGRQLGTPYVMKRDYLFKADPQRGLVMQSRPPWGTLVAIDLHTGSKAWEVPLGYMMDPRKYPEAKNWGSVNFGGAIVTGGNLVFVAASMDGHLRAFDRRNGNLLWEYQLPAGGQATPMSYSIGGKQFIVIAAGGHGKLKTQLGDYLMAFALE